MSRIEFSNNMLFKVKYWFNWKTNLEQNYNLRYIFMIIARIAKEKRWNHNVKTFQYSHPKYCICLLACSALALWSIILLNISNFLCKSVASTFSASWNNDRASLCYCYKCNILLHNTMSIIYWWIFFLILVEDLWNTIL